MTTTSLQPWSCTQSVLLVEMVKCLQSQETLETGTQRPNSLMGDPSLESLAIISLHHGNRSRKRTYCGDTNLETRKWKYE